MTTHRAEYRLTRRGEIVRNIAVLAVTSGCLVATGLVGFGLLVGWFT